MTDNINHPAHYTKYKFEVIKLTERCNFLMGNAFKYILRAPYKGSYAEDLKKAIWYCERQYQMKIFNFFIPKNIKNYFSKVDPIVKILIEYVETGERELLREAIDILKVRVNSGTGENL